MIRTVKCLRRWRRGQVIVGEAHDNCRREVVAGLVADVCRLGEPADLPAPLQDGVRREVDFAVGSEGGNGALASGAHDNALIGLDKIVLGLFVAIGEFEKPPSGWVVFGRGRVREGAHANDIGGREVCAHAGARDGKKEPKRPGIQAHTHGRGWEEERRHGERHR